LLTVNAFRNLLARHAATATRPVRAARTTRLPGTAPPTKRGQDVAAWTEAPRNGQTAAWGRWTTESSIYANDSTSALQKRHVRSSLMRRPWHNDRNRLTGRRLSRCGQR